MCKILHVNKLQRLTKVLDKSSIVCHVVLFTMILKRKSESCLHVDINANFEKLGKNLWAYDGKNARFSHPSEYLNFHAKKRFFLK